MTVVRRKTLLALPSPKSTSWWLSLEKGGVFAEVLERRLSIGPIIMNSLILHAYLIEVEKREDEILILYHKLTANPHQR